MRRLAFSLAAFFAACAADSGVAWECYRSSDCVDGLCVRGSCRVSEGQPDLGAPPDRGPVVAGPCVDARPASADSIVINEVLANPPNGGAGDANADGIRDAHEDEFIELVNRSDHPVDFADVRIRVDDDLKHRFEPVCVLPGATIVVFGGGAIGPTVTGNAVVSDGRLGLSNVSGYIEIGVGPAVADHVMYNDSPEASFTRSPQLTGEAWLSHLDLSTAPFSPGRCADGSNTVTGCPPQTRETQNP